MDEFIDFILEALEKAWDTICEIFINVILNTIVDFLNDVVNYFKGLLLNKDIQKPFILDAKSDKAAIFKDLIPEGKNDGVIEGVFNQQTEDFDSIRYIGGQGVDKETQELIKRDPLVVLN